MKRESREDAKSSRDKKGFPVAVVVTPILAVGVIVAIWLTRPQATAPSPAPADLVRTTNPASSSAAVSDQPASNPNFKPLVGRWVRPDGGYVLEIRGVDSLGVMDAAYFNPNPIHVEKAAALHEGGVTKVYVVLRDVNYPGSTYTLNYDSTSDVLQGNYFQALEQQNFDVAFRRMK